MKEMKDIQAVIHCFINIISDLVDTHRRNLFYLMESNITGDINADIGLVSVDSYQYQY